MQRYNPFNLIHKGLRNLMYDTALLLQQTYFAEEAETAHALAQVSYVIDVFEKHAHHEDHYIFPAVANSAPALVNAFEQEHVKDHELAHKLIVLINIFQSLQNAGEKIVCGSAINQAFREFMIFNLEHMAKEESEINQELWQQYTDEEIMAIQQRLTASIPPAEMMETAKWMLRSINKQEAIHWLKAVKATAPVYAFDGLYNLAESQLNERFVQEVLDAVLQRDLIAV